MGSSRGDGNEFTEAQRLTLLIRDSSYCGRADLTCWLFRRLFQPISQEEETKEEAFSVHNVTGAPNNGTNGYILTPRTRVLTIAQEYRLVFLIDLSSSLATFDPVSGQVILSQVYDTLANILENLVDISVHNPTIRISVVAECSQFGSNMNVIPMLAEYPTLRTFIQNVKLTKANLPTILRILHSALDQFQRDHAKFRHSMAQRRAKMGYELQVRGEHPAVDSDGTGEDVENSMSSREFPTLMDGKHSRKMPNSIGQPDLAKEPSADAAINKTQPQREHRHSRHTNTANTKYQSTQSATKITAKNNRRDVWGVGTTGSELSYILQAGLFALNLLPAAGQGSIVFLTDGVVKSSIKDESLIRHISAKYVSCTIVQLGLGEKSFEQQNYGFIPDIEILQFVAKATGGQFFHASELQQVMMRYKRNGRNLFHEKILARDISFIKSITDNNWQRRSRQLNDDLGDPLSGAQRFVTQAQSETADNNVDIESIAMETRLLRYQKYHVIQPVWYFIAARIRQGFVISSISFENKRIRRSGLNEDDNVNNSKERVTVTLVLQWQPSIYIEYRVRGVLMPQWSLYIKSIRSSLQYPIHPASESTSWLLGSLISTKVEILIRANSTLTHMLQNWDAFQRRCQVMGIVTGAIGDLTRSPGFLKIGKLKRLLARILETDHYFYPLLTLGANRESSSILTREQYIERFRAVWSKLNTLEARIQATAWYDIHCIDLIITYPPEHKLNGNFIKRSSEKDQHHQHHTIEHIIHCLAHWANIQEDGVFVKFLYEESGRGFNNRNDLCFCEIRLSQHTDCNVEIQVHFFNVDSVSRRNVMNDIECCLTGKKLVQEPPAQSASEMVTTGTVMDIQSVKLARAKRPISKLLMRDEEHNFWEKSDRDFIKTCLTDYAVILASEHIARNYLRCEKRLWMLEEAIYDLFAYNGLPNLQDIVFASLYQTRLCQGFILLSRTPNCCHFYKEYANYSMQYYVHQDISSCKVVTEYWLEPVEDSLAEGQDENPLERDWALTAIGEIDKHIITELVTFDRICGDILAPKARGEKARKDYVTSDEPQHRYQDGILSAHLTQSLQLFDIGALLLANTHQWTMYPLPKQYNLQNLSESGSWVHLLRGKDKPDTELRAYYGNAGNETSDTALLKYAGGEDDCTCPRPDAAFLRVREAITEVSSRVRDTIYLHYYFEKCMSTLSDTIINLDSTTSGTMWQTILGSVDMENLRKIDSTLARFSRKLQDLQCFVKVFNASVFLLIFVPTLEAVVGNAQDIKGESISPSHLGILILECHRKPHTAATADHAYEEQLTVQLLDEETTRQYLNDFGCPIIPKIGISSFNGNDQSPLPLSDYRIRVMQDISHIYARCFAKSVYTSLLYGERVDDSDYRKILEICEKIVIAIDLTSYVNLQILLKRNGTFSQEDVNEAYLRCLSILECYFEPLKLGTEGTDQKIYCYRPPQSDPDQVAPGQRQRVATAADIAVCAHTPLFLRLDYVSKVSTTEAADTHRAVHLPFDGLPTAFYRWDGHNIGEYNVDNIVSDKSPVQSIDNAQLMLRMTLMTLPRSRLDPIDISLTHTQGCSSDSAGHHESFMLDIEEENEELLSTVTQEKMEAVCEIKARLAWLFTEELMHGLLRAGPITENVIRFVESQLVKKNPFVDFPTTMFIPLDFVKDRVKSRQIFLEQLTSARTVPYRLVRVGDFFYATENQFISHRTTDNLKVGKRQSPDDVDQVDGFAYATKYQHQEQDQEAGNDDFCQGLGISILEPEGTTEERYSLVDTSQQEYWLLIIPRSHSVQIYFYSKFIQSVNRTEIIRETKSMVNDAMERTNKLVLLHYLHETRICSKYLIPPDGSMDAYQSSSDEYSEEEYDDSTHSGDNLVEILSTSGEDTAISPPKKFTAGQFACDVVYTRHYPLHWRLPPFSALGILSNDVLRHFMVKNRPNTFVYMRDDQVLYCTLREEMVAYPEHEPRETGIDFASSAGKASPPIFPHSDVELHPRGSVVSSATPSSPHGSHMSDAGSSSKHDYGSYPARKPRSYESRELRLEVHGVDLPDWICQELADLLENRLTLQITLKEVQQFLARNPTSKLSRADIEFLMPVDKTPNEHASFQIPGIALFDTHRFQYLLRENILLRPLRVLNGSSLNSILRSYKLRRYGIHFNPFAPPAACDDLCFYYSCISKNPGTCTEFEMMTGQGLASVMLSFIGDGWTSKTTADPDNFGQSIAEWSAKVCKLRIMDDAFMTASKDPDALSIDLAIWTMGQIDHDYLKSYVQDCIQQSVCDFIIDKTVARLAEAALRENFMFMDKEAAPSILEHVVPTLLRAMQKFSKWSDSPVESLDKHIDLYPWCLSDILTQVDNEVSMLSPGLRPIWLNGKEQEENGDGSYRRTLLITDTFQDGDIDHYLFERVESISSSGNGDERHRREASMPSWTEDTSAYSRYNSLSAGLSAAMDPKVKATYKDALHRPSFLIVSTSIEGCEAYTYNFFADVAQSAMQIIQSVINRQDLQCRALRNIMHQKMGLFHHHEGLDASSPIDHIQNACSSAIPDPTIKTPMMIPRIQHLTSKSHSRTQSEQGSLEDKSKGKVDPSTFKRLMTDTSTLQQDSGSTSSFDIERIQTRASTELLTIDPILTAANLTHENSVLRYAYTSPAAQGMDKNCLQRHSGPFLATHIQRSELKAAHDKAFKVYTKWAERYSLMLRDPEQKPEMMPVAELKLILKASRLLHFCRTPLTFSETCVTKAYDVDRDHGSTKAWYETLADTFMKEYSAYLETAGMRLIVYGPSNDDAEENEAYLSQFRIAKDAVVSSPVIYLLQVFEGGTIMCEARLTDTFVFVTLYTLHRRYGRLMPQLSNSIKNDQQDNQRVKFKEFTNECDRFKQRIHVNSFVFDFHIRFLQRSLDNIDKLPPNVDILAIIRTLLISQSPPASYSRNRILHGYYQLDAECPSDLLSFMIRNARKLGLRGIHLHGHPTACFISSSRLSFEEIDDPNSHYRYTLIIAPPYHTDEAKELRIYESQDQYLAVNRLVSHDKASSTSSNNHGNSFLQYYILVSCHFCGRKKRTWSIAKPYSSKRLSDPLDEKLGGTTLRRIAEQAVQKIDSLSSKAVYLFERDKDWNALYRAVNGQNIEENCESLVLLAKSFHRTDMRELSPAFKQLLELRLDWNDLLSMLRRLFVGISGDIIQKGISRHLLIFVPDTSLETFLYFELDMRQDNISVYLSGKDTKYQKDTLTSSQQRCIKEAVLALNYHIWKRTLE